MVEPVVVLVTSVMILVGAIVVMRRVDHNSTIPPVSSGPAPASRTEAAAPPGFGLGPNELNASNTPPFVAVTGAGCTTTANAGYTTSGPNNLQLTLRTKGGWIGTGCNGAYWTLPKSGIADRDDPDTFVTWWFVPGPSSRGACTVWVYIPRAERAPEVAGRPAKYLVIRGRDDPTVIGGFEIDQTLNRGLWVQVGRYAYDRGQFAIRLVNRGTNAAVEQIGAAQLWVSCQQA